MNYLISGGRVIDPKNSRDGIFDVWLANGKIGRVEKKILPKGAHAKISARGMWVLPGLIDVHVHLREPGGEESETIETGTRAAALGGVTTVLAMANTKPPIDSPQQVRFVLRRARETGCVRVLPVGAVTKNLEGKELTDIAAMIKAGCVALSDDGRCVMNSRILRRALEHARAHKIPIIEHCEDENLSLNGAMNEGTLSLKLGLRGIPKESETVMVARNIFLAELTGGHIHMAHLSCAGSIELMRRALAKKISVSAETCPHYFSLTEEAVERYDTHAKMKPPLREKTDAQAIREALADGTIDIIASDHAPHHSYSKEKEFSQAPFGIIGLETMFPLAYNELVLKKVLTPIEAVRKFTENPARIFDLEGGHISPGAPADLVLFDPDKEWTAQRFASRSANSPFLGRKFKGKIMTTLAAGKIVVQNGGLANVP